MYFRKRDQLKIRVDDALRKLKRDGTIRKLEDIWWSDDPWCDYESSEGYSI